MDEDDPRAGAPRRFAPKIVGGIDCSGEPKDKKQALAHALEPHGPRKAGQRHAPAERGRVRRDGQAIAAGTTVGDPR